MTTVPTPEALIESFPHPSLPKIIGQPTYLALSTMKKLIAANAASVPSREGGGAHGYLGMVLSAAVYATVSGTPFVNPNNPGATPIIPGGTTAAATGVLTRTHTEDLRNWKEYNNMQNALKKQVIDAIEPIYLRSLRNRHVGYANHTIRDLITYLIDTYGLITPIDLKKNNDLLNTAWDPNTPFEYLVDQVEEAVEYADDGNQPFTAQQIINAAYTIVFNTGIFFEECKHWRLLPAVDKTWDRFKEHFTDAYHQHRLQQATMQGAGYHKANFLSDQHFPYEETAAALANLATATAADRQVMANLTNTIEALTKQLAASQAEIAELKKGGRTITPRPPRTRGQDHGSYCWSHGYLVGVNHNSATCKIPRDGHQRGATRTNPMEGSTRGKPN
jgi:hypothetical protein